LQFHQHFIHITQPVVQNCSQECGDIGLPFWFSKKGHTQVQFQHQMDRISNIVVNSNSGAEGELILVGKDQEK
jgi:hypothetical protein